MVFASRRPTLDATDNDAEHLANLGISHVWMPPAFKATNEKDVGYGVYDLFDLGEFQQKGTVRTKYGFKEDYLQAIQALKAQGIQPMADVVLNHKAAADHMEAFQVIEVDPEDRTVQLSEPFYYQWLDSLYFRWSPKTPTMTFTGTGTTLQVRTTMQSAVSLVFT